MHTKISLISVTYNSENIIEEFLSQKEIKFFNEVIIVDNNSIDQTPDIIYKKFPNVKLIKNKINLGYGTALNIGCNYSKNNNVILINPDTTFTKDFYIKLLNAINVNRNYSVLVPNLVEFGDLIPESKNNKSQLSKAKFFGSCFFVNLDAFSDNKIFDERIFLFFEDYDLIKRLENINEKKIMINDCFLFFKRGESSKKDNVNKIKNWHFGWSYCYVSKKYNSYLSYKLEVSKYFIKCIKRFLIYLILNNKVRFNRNYYQLKGALAFVRGVEAKKINDQGPF